MRTRPLKAGWVSETMGVFEDFFFLSFFFSFHLAACAYTHSSASPKACTTCRQSGTCQLPDCLCCGDQLPGVGSQRPQLVYFTFDDAVTQRNSGIYATLFNATRVNPDGCPISLSLFVSHNNTDYRWVREFYERGADIGVHSVNHNKVKDMSTFRSEAVTQKEYIADLANIPREDIVGWRSPYLIPAGNAQFEVLTREGFLYDATLTFTRFHKSQTAPVPFTLDYGWPYACMVKECPTKTYPGFWEVPVVSIMDQLGKYPCVYVDGCNIPPTDEEASFQLLWQNFLSYYTTTRTPFGINMHASWLLANYEVDPYRMRAMERFIDKILALGDVYIVNVRQLLHWIRYQPTLSEISRLTPWLCSNSAANRHTTRTANSWTTTSHLPAETTSSYLLNWLKSRQKSQKN